MSVVPGTRLGPYEISSPIGAGGMGEVWKARDTRLDRSVAIKILPSEFEQNAQLRLRFEREAKTISLISAGADGRIDSTSLSISYRRGVVPEYGADVIFENGSFMQEPSPSNCSKATPMPP